MFRCVSMTKREVFPLREPCLVAIERLAYFCCYEQGR